MVKHQKHGTENGFTLIELSIVLVIIGLIVGGVLVGQNLIAAAAVRAQVSQIEKYNTAVNTFYGKYGYLPGDIPNPYAQRFGFLTRGGGSLGGVGEGDGNGLIEAYESQGDCGTAVVGLDPFSAELGTFWVDLSTAKLIDGSFSMASPASDYEFTITGTQINSYLPQAKIGNGNYVYVWSGGWSEATTDTDPGDSHNYFGLSAVTSNAECHVISNTSLTVAQAYAIDKKMDDGLPQSGNVTAMYPSTLVWAAGGGNSGAEAGNGGPTTAATQGSATTCYDNNNTIGQQKYSVQQNNGANANCALSFRFQ